MDKTTVDRILQKAMNRFNEEMGTQYSMDNVKREYFNPDNAPKVYERFCSRYFPNRLDDDYRSPDYFSDSIAMAFIGTEYDGILCNEQFCEESTQECLYEVFLHEFSHIFCAHNETEGGNFYGKYCSNNSGDSYTDGIMNAGYAVWREFIADVMADCVCEYKMCIGLSDARPEIAWHWERITHENSNAKRHLSELLFLLVTSRETALADTWDGVRKHVQKLNVIRAEIFYNLFEEVWENLNRDNYWEIDDEFIYALGSDYLSLLVLRRMGKE